MDDRCLVCADCGGGMEPIDSVPVLQSLEGYAIHRCDGCGHILLVQQGNSESRADWLALLFADCEPAISCACAV